MKTFNTAGTCRPNEHYMVDITDRLEIIRKMVAKGDYFCINRGRQYGKTTTLAGLAEYLKNDYCVFSISFEGLDDNVFASAVTVCAEFLKILKSVLRNMFLSREMFKTFQSVILAGVYDIKNLKLKIRTEGEHQYNSPWNIAVPFDVDMSLSAKGIAEMLAEYKTDHNLTFNEVFVGQMIRDYTSGYPFLVSRLCQIIDAEHLTWDKEGILKAVNAILVERNTLFDNMIKKLDEYPELKQLLKSILLTGKTKSYNPDEKYIQMASMLNYIVSKQSLSNYYTLNKQQQEIWLYQEIN